jgi:hypothetical protein
MTTRITSTRPTNDAACQQVWDLMKQASLDALTDGVEYHFIGLGSAGLKTPNRGYFAKWLLSKGYARKNDSGLAIFAFERFGFGDGGQVAGLSAKCKQAAARVMAEHGIPSSISVWTS